MWNQKSAKVLILIPAYNAASSLNDLIKRIGASVDNPDILVVDDGSQDDTEQILKSSGVKYINSVVNRGKGHALRTGFTHAVGNGYDYVITLDADLQHLPEELLRFYENLGKGDIYIGTRNMHASRMPFLRSLTNNLTSLIISIFGGVRFRDSQSGYRMMAVDLLDKIEVRSDRYDFESELLFRLGMMKARVIEIPISTIYEGSKSYINPFIDTGRFIKLIWKRIMF